MKGETILYIKSLPEKDKTALKQRADKIKELQEQGICFGCYNFITGEIFPDEGLIFYEDDKVRCQFEKYPRITGQAIIVSKEHFVKEDGIIMDYHEMVEIYKQKMKELMTLQI